MRAMAARVRIYHNPRCSKSRQTLALLESRGWSPEVVLYLENPPTAEQVEEIIDRLGIEPHDLLRTGEPQYQALGLSKRATRQEVARAIAREPILLERPVVVAGSKARIGRPPERVLEIL
jgi:arsenate reductase